MAFRTRVQSNQVTPLSNHGIDNDGSADVTDSSSGALETRAGPKERLGRMDSILLACYINTVLFRASFIGTKIILLILWIGGLDDRNVQFNSRNITVDYDDEENNIEEDLQNAGFFSALSWSAILPANFPIFSNPSSSRQSTNKVSNDHES